VVIDYFMKWAEAMPTLKNTANTITSFKTFFLNHVITHFGAPKQLVSYHGTHFEHGVFQELVCQVQILLVDVAIA